jgi:AraC-like DNA-binding protein
MFEDEFRLRPLHWAGFVIYTALVMVYRFVEFDMMAAPAAWYDILVDVVTFAMLAHLGYVALRGRADDLIAPRRRLRLFFVLALTLGSASTVLAESLFIEDFGKEVTLLRAATALPLTLWGLLWLTKFQSEKLSFQAAAAAPVKPTGLDPRDKALQGRLELEMQERKTYLEPNLTIRTLAEKLKTPEHRLRTLINQGLGYRNFSAFLNTYRIKEVKAAFADPDMARIPVLTIAMDAGYNSLAPFNRAFLKSEGMTPSAYRQALPAKSDQ